MNISIEERFWRKVDKTSNPDGCWEWTAHKIHNGYGRFNEGTRLPSGNLRMVLAHRWSYEQAHGPIPDGLKCDHMCHNRACVNPDHIQLVTVQQNNENLQGARKGSSSGVRGVHWHKQHLKWQVAARSGGKNHYGGLFTSLADAEAAVIALRMKVQTNNLVDLGENISGAAAEVAA